MNYEYLITRHNDGQWIGFYTWDASMSHWVGKEWWLGEVNPDDWLNEPNPVEALLYPDWFLYICTIPSDFTVEGVSREEFNSRIVEYLL